MDHLPRQLNFTDDALADLDAIARWLTQPGSGQKARKRLTAIWAAIERVRQYPCLYPVVDHPGVRELPCPGGYRLLYQLDHDTGRNTDAGDVLVLKVYGPGQDRSGF